MGISEFHNLFADLQNQRDLSRKLANIHVEQGTFGGLNASRVTSVFAPLHYEEAHAYPLIVWLHTPGADEKQLLRVMPMISLRNYVAVAVRGARTLGWNGLPLPGYHWEPAGSDAAASAVIEAIEQARERYNVHSRRVYLVGTEEGGTMALRIALRNPTFFAGVASLDGAIPEDTVLLERLRDVRKLRILFEVSRHSPKCPMDPLCENLKLMYSAGLKVTLKNYPTAGALQLDMLRDLDRWIMQGIEGAML